jgi:hypothetical protein
MLIDVERWAYRHTLDLETIMEASRTNPNAPKYKSHQEIIIDMLDDVLDVWLHEIRDGEWNV